MIGHKNYDFSLQENISDTDKLGVQNEINYKMKNMISERYAFWIRRDKLNSSSDLSHSVYNIVYRKKKYFFHHMSRLRFIITV